MRGVPRRALLREQLRHRIAGGAAREDSKKGVCSNSRANDLFSKCTIVLGDRSTMAPFCREWTGSGAQEGGSSRTKKAKPMETR